MKPEKVFKRYDIRGRYPEEVDEVFAERLGKSLGAFVSENYSSKVVVGRDNKSSSKDLKEAFIHGLASYGVEVVDVGIGPTDYVAYSGKKVECVSVQVTSSHMPLEFNGFKFMYPEGNGFLNPDLNRVKELFRENRVNKAEKATVEERSLKQDYINSLHKFVERYSLEWEGKNIVLDCLGGSTLPFAKQVLEELGCNVYCIDLEGEDQSLDSFSPYRDPPNPKEEQLEKLMSVVDDKDADLGLSFDLDGDRVALYHDGSLVSGDKVFAILAGLVSGDVVGSIDTSSGVTRVLDSRNCEFYSTRVGDPFVMDEAIKKGVELSGEPNGHYSFLDFVPYNSGILTGVVLAGLDLDSRIKDLPKFSVLRESIRVDNKQRAMDKVGEFVENDGRVELLSDLDGFKFLFDGCSVLARSSGSSSKIRFMISSTDPDVILEDIFSELVEMLFLEQV